MRTIKNQVTKNAYQEHRMQKFVITLLAYAIMSITITSCNKNDCKDDPCAEGCGECPEVCLNDPCGNPEDCPGLCPEFDDGTLSKSNLKGEGNVVETPDGMSVDGKLTITTPDVNDVTSNRRSDREWFCGIRITVGANFHFQRYCNFVCKIKSVID